MIKTRAAYRFLRLFMSANRLTPISGILFVARFLFIVSDGLQRELPANKKVKEESPENTPTGRYRIKFECKSLRWLYVSALRCTLFQKQNKLTDSPISDVKLEKAPIGTDVSLLDEKSL